MGYAARMGVPLVQVPSTDAWAYAAQADFVSAETWLGKPVAACGALGPDRAALPAGLRSGDRAGTRRRGPACRNLEPAFASPRQEARDADRARPASRLYDLPDAPRPDADTPAPVRFLPEWDSVIVTRADERVVAKADRPRVFLPGLRIAALVLVDGMAAASWKVSATSKKAHAADRVVQDVARRRATRGRGRRRRAAALRRARRDDVRREGDDGMSAPALLLGVAVIVFGVVALVAPVLPGVAIIYLGILIVAWADNFTRIGPLMLFVMLGADAGGAGGRQRRRRSSARAAPAHRAGASSAPASARWRGWSSGCRASCWARPSARWPSSTFRNPDAKKALRAGAGGFLGFVLGVSRRPSSDSC